MVTMTEQPAQPAPDPRRTRQLRRRAALIQLALCAWWFVFALYYGRVGDDPAVTTTAQGKGMAFGIAMLTVAMFATSAGFALSTATLFSEHQLARLWSVYAALGIFLAAPLYLMPAGPHYGFVDAPFWTVPLIGGWANLAAGAAILVILARTRRRARHPRRDDGLAGTTSPA
jgi:hypothetical protein